MQMMRQAFDFNNQILKTPLVLLGQLYLIIREGFWAILPLLLLILVLSACAPLLMGGWVFSAEVLQPKLSRLNPLKGFKRMFSLKGAVEMAKALVKFLLVVTVAIVVLRWKITFLLSLADFSLSNAISSGLTTVAQCFLLISASLILIAAVDVPFQWHEHNKQLKMTKQELKDEYKETEGKPEVKSHIRKMQQEMARKRMMSEVPKADVVLTNPTHYAVALNYKQQGKKAPVVVAKGKDLIALQINRVAQANNVPSLAVPALTRAIYFSTELNAEIPRGLYVAVAQVLAYIFQLKDKKYYDKNPEFLQNLPIPDEFNRTKKSKTIS